MFRAIRKLYFEDIEGGLRDEERISSWEKSQDCVPGNLPLWDHNFEVPHKNLDAEQTVMDSVTAGKVSHKLKVAGNDQLEVYEYPGGYATRLRRSARHRRKIFTDNKRTVGIRMQQAETPMLLIAADANYRQVTRVSVHAAASLQRRMASM